MKKEPNIPFTKEKYNQMKAEVAKLLQEREEVMGRLVTAREMGDLSENGAYKYAKFELGDIKRKLRKLHYLLDNGFISEKITSDAVNFGSTVTIQDANGKEKKFTIVSEHESNPAEGKLSYKSPIGEQLLNKKVGNTIIVTSPKGEKEYSISAIS